MRSIERNREFALVVHVVHSVIRDGIVVQSLLLRSVLNTPSLRSLLQLHARIEKPALVRCSCINRLLHLLRFLSYTNIPNFGQFESCAPIDEHTHTQ